MLIHKRSMIAVTTVGILFASLVVWRVANSADYDATVFIAFGREDPVTAQYGRDRLGDIYLRDGLGHDGKFYFIQSNDPLVLDSDSNAAFLDRPLYRSQRMFYPLVASVGGLVNADGLVWTMVATNILAMGAGALVVGLIAGRMGGSAWWGLAFPLNPGFISEMTIDGAGVLAALAAFTAVLFLMRESFVYAVIALSISVLSREAFLLTAAALAIWLWTKGERRKAAVIGGVPLGLAAMWGLYLRLQIGWDSGANQVQEIGIPFAGFLQAFDSWIGDPIDLAAGLAIMLLLVLYTRRVVMTGRLVGWAFVGFVLLAVLFTEQVWRNYFDIMRAVGPVLTSFVLLVFATADSRNRRTGVRTTG